ncbi:hypothetical protein ASPFODRAFT_234834 [Aspergillus luchuensis CBS 106.47]|uniref:Uncharacterized protein n=1 Tax=Aspergillus luchuensis (strain CBS 106.47) TaxID=1137211 RepID=A0A1M3TYG0_ASPLC|nr:hypothetical protein ASPFODRAFT_234834 [Aspergillus luchuensis CBS 106.47]
MHDLVVTYSSNCIFFSPCLSLCTSLILTMYISLHSIRHLVPPLFHRPELNHRIRHEGYVATATAAAAAAKIRINKTTKTSSMNKRNREKKKRRRGMNTY